MGGLLKVAIVAVLTTALLNMSTAYAVGDVDFSGEPTWGETPDDSAVYVCIPEVRDGLSMFVSYPLGPTQTTDMWGPLDLDRPAGFKGGLTSFTLWHPYSATEVHFDLRLADVPCSSELSLPDPAPQRVEFQWSTGDVEGLLSWRWGYDCETELSFVEFLEFGTPGTPGTEPDGFATFSQDDWVDDECDYDFDGNFPDLEYYQQRAAVMEESSALPNTV